MALKDITPGHKLAKAVGMQFVEVGAKKTPAIRVGFTFEEPSTGTEESLDWLGYLTDGAKARTMDTLKNTLGYDGSDDTDKDGYFPVLSIDRDREVDIDCDFQEYEGKQYMRINWVNPIGGARFGAIAPEVVKSQMAKVGFKALFLSTQGAPQARTTPAATPEAKKEIKNHAPQTSTKIIPF